MFHDAKHPGQKYDNIMLTVRKMLGRKKYRLNKTLVILSFRKFALSLAINLSLILAASDLRPFWIKYFVFDNKVIVLKLPLNTSSNTILLIIHNSFLISNFFLQLFSLKD